MSHKEHDTENKSHQELEMEMMDYLAGRMSAEQVLAFEQLIADHPEYSQELVELQQMMALIDQHNQAEVPEPSAQMDENFYAMLHEEVKKEVHQNNQWWHRLTAWAQLPQVRKFTYACSFLVVGVFMGHYMHLLSNQTDLDAQRLAVKDQQIQALTVLSLLDMPSANKRLMAVNLAAMTEQPNEAIFKALLTTLSEDSNTNVRLEALDALAQHTDNQAVRTGLVAAINQQKSPMVQIAIANLMLKLNETEAVKPIRDLLQQPDLIEPVRNELNDTLDELI